MTREVEDVVRWLRAHAIIWRSAVSPPPRDNILVADTLDGAANAIEAGTPWDRPAAILCAKHGAVEFMPPDKNGNSYCPKCCLEALDQFYRNHPVVHEDKPGEDR